MQSTKLWINKIPQKEIFYELVSKGCFTPLIAQILANKGFTDVEKAYSFLYPRLEDFSNPFELPDTNSAVKRIHQAIEKKEVIGIYGDSDTDGIVGSFVLAHFLKSLGAKVEVLIPSKEKFGYGFHPEFLSWFKQKGVTLLITVDVGISAEETVNQAKSMGIDVIVTDHHEITSLPPCIVVSGKLLPSSSPFYNLCGTGVSFTLIRALRTYLYHRGYFKNEMPNLRKYLELVGLATLADMVPIEGENRVITYFGFRDLSDPEFLPVKVLIKNCNIKYGITEEDLYFKLIPRLNAAGRLGKPEVVLNFLFSETEEEAEFWWKEIENLNNKRQEIELKAVESLLSLAEEQAKDSSVIFLTAENLPKGLLGLVANRFKNMYQMPVLVITYNNGIAFGSARAPEGINFLKVVKECEDLLIELGGHKRAFGFQLKTQNLEVFKEKLGKVFKRKEEESLEKIYIDAQVSLSELLLQENQHALAEMHPYGYAHEAPVLLLKNFEVKECQILKDKHSKLFLSWAGETMVAICFNRILNKDIKLVVGSPFINTYKKQLEINVKDVR